MSDSNWKFPNSTLPSQGDLVEVIICDGRQCLGKFLADNNWEIRGCGVDLFNYQIVAWRRFGDWK